MTRALAAGTMVILFAAGGLSAHEKKTAGQVVLTIGWGDEPALSGARNTVEIAVADAAGTPVVDPAAALSVDVRFGSDQVTLPLAADARRPGHYRAWLIPTRPGAYTFHISGTIRNQPVNVTSVCSEKTFDCVADGSDLQFPAKDPSPAQVAERVARALPRADEAAGKAVSARWIAIGAFVVAIAALGAALRPKA